MQGDFDSYDNQSISSLLVFLFPFFFLPYVWETLSLFVFYFSILFIIYGKVFLE